METNNLNQQQSGLGIAGMVIGIISILLTCTAVGGFLGIVGLILSIIGVTQKNKKWELPLPVLYLILLP